MTDTAAGRKNTKKEMWVNPVGSLGDILMLSGILKQCIEKDPLSEICLVRRAIYADLLKDHTAIKKVGHPPKNARVITTDYWLKEKPGVNHKRPYQILARMFGLQTPVTESLFLPGEYDDDRLFLDLIPQNGNGTAMIAPGSHAPRKMPETSFWQNLVEALKCKGIIVIQVGLKDDTYVKGAYSLLGLTTSRQLISLLGKCDLIISVDNFIMHAAHLVGKPAIILWGPTDSRTYGYARQIHIQCPTDHCEFRNKCMDPEFPENSTTPCPLNDRHCMHMVPTNTIIEKAINSLSIKKLS